MKLRDRFDAWVQGMVDKAVDRLLPCTSAVEDAVCEKLDLLKLAGLVSVNERLGRAVTEQLEDEIDTDEIIRKVVRQIDASDVASYIDTSDVASNLDIDTSEIAERVMEDMDMGSLAEQLDYDKLAESMVSKLKEAWTK